MKYVIFMFMHPAAPHSHQMRSLEMHVYAEEAVLCPALAKVRRLTDCFASCDLTCVQAAA